MREGPGPGQSSRVAAAAAARRRGAWRLVAAVALAALGLTAAAAGFAGLARATARSIQPLREAATPADAQRFTFDRTAWRAVPVDDVFPPVYHTLAGDPLQGAVRDYTRIGVAPAADCRTAFDPGLARLLSGHPCGPVLRVDYTDATRTMVATSPAAALVSGVVALILSRFPKLTPAQVRDVLQRSASRPGGGYSEDLGWGVVQAAPALRLAATLTPDAAVPRAAGGRSRLLGGGAGGAAVPRVGLGALDVGAWAVPAALLPASGLLLLGAVLLLAMRPARTPPRSGTMGR